MKRLKHIVFLLLVSASFYACEDQIQIDLNDPKPVLVVEGQVIDKDTIQWVRLSYIQNYNSTVAPDYTAEKNATVALYEDSILIGNLVYIDSTQRFEIQHEGVLDHTYFIVITTQDGTEYRSEPEKINIVTPIDSLWTEKEDNRFEDGFSYNILMNTFETPGRGDNYQWKVFINDIYQSDPFDIIITDDRFVDGQPITAVEIYSMSDEKFNDYRVSSPNGKVIVTIAQTAITKTYFDFLTELVQQTAFVGGPFDSPPAEIRGNVYKTTDFNDRALGFFFASSVETKSVEVIP